MILMIQDIGELFRKRYIIGKAFLRVFPVTALSEISHPAY